MASRNYARGEYAMKHIVLFTVMSTVCFVLSGCFPTQQLRFQQGDITITADQSGCAIRNVAVTNSGGQERKVHGEINVLNANSSTVMTASYYCPTVYPGGQVICQTSLVGHGDISSAGGPGCPGYARYMNKPFIY
jgi:hypothetical protein